ncbi:MAG: hypothetical protein QXQ40_01865 [Candidatus Aenigmatarchaeota archaeon]
MVTFKEERYPNGTITSTEIALYWACPRNFAYVDQTEGISFFPFPVDQKKLLNLRHSWFWRVYSNILKDVRDEGKRWNGIPRPDMIYKIVGDNYSDLRIHVGEDRKKLKEWFRNELNGVNTQYATIGDFLNTSVEYANQVFKGESSLKDKLLSWAQENYPKDNPNDIIIGVDSWGELRRDDLVSRPNLIVAFKNPDRIEMSKLKGGHFTDDYLRKRFLIDQAKLAMDYYLYRMDERTLKEAAELFNKPIETEWDKAEIGILLPDRVRIISSDINSKCFNASEFKKGLEIAREELKRYKRERPKWNELPHKEDTCPGAHPIG